MKIIKKVCAVIVMGLMTAIQVNAQKTMDGMQLLTVNENITTVITASEPVRFVDISTDKVVGDQPINNTIRLKPKEGVEVNRDGESLQWSLSLQNVTAASMPLFTHPIKKRPLQIRQLKLMSV